MLGGSIPSSRSSGGDGSDNVNRWVGHASVRGGERMWVKMLCCTSSLLGLEMVWGAQASFAGPQLLSLGLSKKYMALVFLAGPISGLFVQPIVGIQADKCHSRWGRRRPFIFYGVIICSIALLLLGWSREVASILTKSGSTAHSHLSISLAILAVYLIDSSVNAVMAADRSLIVDVLPSDLQQTVNAYAGRMAGVGSVLAFFLNSSSLTTTSVPLISRLGKTQIQIALVLAVIILIICHSITCFAVTERVLLPQSSTSERREERAGLVEGVAKTFRGIWKSYLSVPREIEQLFHIQFFSWLGWMGILAYATVWIAEKKAHELARNPPLPSDSPDDSIVEKATRAGSRAMLSRAVITLICCLIWPVFVSPSTNQSNSSPSSSAWVDRLHDILPPRIVSLLPTIPFPWLDLTRTWSLSNGVFAILMGMTFWVGNEDPGLASWIIAVTGIPWGLAITLPFALLGEFILMSDMENKDEDDLDMMEDGLPLRAVGVGDGQGGRFIPPLTPISEGVEPDEDSNSQAWSLDVPRSPGAGTGSANRSGVGGRPGSLSLSIPNGGSSKGPLPGDVPGASQAQPTTRVLEVRHDELGIAGEDEEGSRETDSLRDHRPVRRGDADVAWEDRQATGNASESAGVILGLHNIFVTLPQMFVTLGSSIIFSILAPDKSALAEGVPAAPGGPEETENSWDAIGVVLRLGGIAAVVAAWLAWKLAGTKRASGRYERMRGLGITPSTVVFDLPE